jgi:hypothetical protein
MKVRLRSRNGFRIARKLQRDVPLDASEPGAASPFPQLVILSLFTSQPGLPAAVLSCPRRQHVRQCTLPEPVPIMKQRWEWPGALLARRTRTIKGIGRTPTLVLCSRNACPEKGLVRRPHVDQHGCPSKRVKASKLGRIIQNDEDRSMRAVKGNLGHSPQQTFGAEEAMEPDDLLCSRNARPEKV